ncbi:Peroxisomal membrane protein PEX14 [Tolypocladium paradoxum]|uniref:Peroxisomal membrane protein PEX14 n=1 Tax=Tolypocladium paradoxum TaxID=94208 RepID=A0A2S4L4J0_9HYPO|nr:Peroxisomal membrane protein PEX14 [Tolypocladium paradoxum]
MAIREDLVASADPSVSSSSVENKISFLRTKNLTREEIDAALARAGAGPAPPPPSAPYASGQSGPPQPYYQPYPQYAWQPAPPPAPGRDWRDWFIMATVVSGVGYGLYSLGKRYVYPLVAPPTPERLEQDKKSIEEQFDKAFALVEQLAKDTEALKSAEQQRTEKLDTAMAELETVMSDLKAANRRREDDAQRIRDEVRALKDAIPKAMNNQKDLTDNRLSEINTELTSLKTLVSQRMSSSSAPAMTSSYLRPTSGANASAAGRPPAPTGESAPAENSIPAASELPKSLAQSSFNKPSVVNGGGSGAKASIPAWQMAAANKIAAASTSAANGAEGEGSEQKEAGSST